LQFMRLLKSFRDQFRHFMTSDNRKITDRVYKSPYSLKFNWLLNEFNERILRESYDTITLIRDCLARSETGTAFNLYVDNFMDISKKDRYDLGYIFTKLSFGKDPGLRRNWIKYDAPRAFIFICENEDYAHMFCENVRELFFPVLFRFLDELGFTPLGCNMFLSRCILNTESCGCRDHFMPLLKLCSESGNSKIIDSLLKHQTEFPRGMITRIPSLQRSLLKIPRQVATSVSPEELAKVILNSKQIHFKWFWKLVFTISR
jgi:hypothetical protein